MRFTLYIDGLFYKSSGIGRYYESLTKELAKNGIKIYTSIPKKFRKFYEKDFCDISNITPIFVDYEKFSIKGFVHQSKILKFLENKVDLFFYPHINFPFYVPKKTIVTVHDLCPLTEYWDRSNVKRWIFKFCLNRAIRSAIKIICISNTVKNELHSFSNKSITKTVVIYRFVDEKFQNHDKISKKRVVNNPYILFVGNRKKHKNLKILIKAFSIIKDKIPHYLVIAGTKDGQFDEIDRLKKNLNLKNKLIEFIKPDDEIVKNLYHYADLFVFPSLCEGFGLPPLEAISMGCPVVLADIPILREVFRKDACYFNPKDEDNLAKMIIELLKNKELKERLLLKQREILKIYNKDKIVNEYIRLFEQIIK